MPQYTEDQNIHAEQAIAYNASQELGNKPIWMTGEGFICFKPYLDEPREKPDGTQGAYEIAIALPIACPVAKEIAKQMKAFRVLKFEKARGVREPFKKGDDYLESLLADADAEEVENIKSKYGALRGHVFFNAKTKFPLNEEGRAPQLIDEYGQALDAKKVNGSAIVRIQIAPFSYNQPGNKGVAFGLRSVQVLSAGEFAGGGSSDTASAFTSKKKPVDAEDAAAAFKAPETDDVAEPLDDDSMFS